MMSLSNLLALINKPPPVATEQTPVIHRTDPEIVKALQHACDKLSARLDRIGRSAGPSKRLMISRKLSRKKNCHLPRNRKPSIDCRERMETAMTDAERWDETFAKLGRAAPAQRADESTLDYQRRLGRVGRKYLPKYEELANLNFRQLPDAVVPKFSEMMREAVERNIFRVDNMEPGELRAVPQPGANGSRTTCSVGPDSFVKAMGLPARRVVRINAPRQGTLYTSNRAHLSGLWGG